MSSPSSTPSPRVGDLLDGRVALVTGGASGIGLGMATAMARYGAAAVLACRRTETGEPAAEALRADGHDATCVRCDVTEPDDVGHAPHLDSARDLADVIVDFARRSNAI